MQSTVRNIEGLQFRFVCKVEPVRDPEGRIIEYMPQGRYRASRTTRLNPNGQGPFCRFRIPSNCQSSGVYALTIDDQVKYVGECVNLARRWGLSQFGSIQPKNCNVGGQSTNCKVNHGVLQASLDGGSVVLWFHETDDRKQRELMLRTKLQPEWNSR